MPTTGNRLYYGDNLEILRRHVKDESVDLVYLDPPFNSNRSYNVLFKTKSGDEAQAQIEAFDDTWTWSQQSEAEYEELLDGDVPPQLAHAVEAMRRLLGENDLFAYLVMMAARLAELHRALRPTGSMYLHCDPVASHYLKVICDAVFDPRNFQNEVIWKRATTVKGNFGQGSRKWGPNTDTLLFYTKSDKTSTFSPQFTDYSQKYIDTAFRFIEPSTGRRYRLISMIGPGGAAKGNPYYEVMGVSRYWRYSRARMQELIDQGLVVQSKPGAVPHRKQYLDVGKGVPVQSLWDDIPNLQAADAERLGYPTQKPVALLKRIIAASSNPGDTVLDPFCGCGTTVDAAQALGRHWIGIDISYLAIALIQDRLADTYGDELRREYEVVGIPHDLAGAQALFKANAFDFERWAVTVIGGRANQKQVGDRGIDGVISFPLDKRTRGSILVSVKGGAALNPAMVRELRGTIEREKAEMGVLVTLTTPTRGMVEEANRSGTYHYDLTGASFPRLQIITVPEILAGKRPAGPAHFRPYAQAKRGVADNQLSMFEE